MTHKGGLTMGRRNLEKERRRYIRMYHRHDEAQREITERHFAAVKTQHSDGCDCGRKIKPKFDGGTDDTEEGSSDE